MASPTDTQVLAAARGQRGEPLREPVLTRHRGGSGPPLVLLHGLGLSSRSWQPVLTALQARHDVVAIDLPGFGESPPLPAGVEPTPARLADAIEAELDRLGLAAPAVVGNSLGGWLALELARRGRAERAVVISPAGLETPAERAVVIALNEMMRIRARIGAPLGRWLTEPSLARVALFGGLRGRPWRVSPDEAERDLRDFGYSPGFQSTLRSTVGTSVQVRLGEIRVPVRVVFGTLDLMLGVFTAPRFVAAIPGAELVALLALGHVPMLDDPDLVARTILDFTADTDSATRSDGPRHARAQSPTSARRPSTDRAAARPSRRRAAPTRSQGSTRDTAGSRGSTSSPGHD
jgi:pimeloyl-ACP methyl ester carboxylesterase